MSDLAHRKPLTFRGRWIGLALLIGCTVMVVSAAPAIAADCPDSDGDGYAVCGGCDLPSGKTCGDCNDSNAAIKPGATEVCDGVDNDCDGLVDLADPDLAALYDDIDDPAFDDDGDGDLDEGFGYCEYNIDGPGPYPDNVCVTGGRLECFGTEGVQCANLTNNVITYEAENLAAGNCFDGVNNDCDVDEFDNELTDVLDPDCQEPESCDGIDNDGDGEADEDFDDGDACTVGVGECERSGIYVCTEDGSSTECSASPGSPKNEGVNFGLSCENGDDDDCDGLTDAADPDCAGFGDPELCGNGIDDDGDGFIDEGFPTLGTECAAGTGACTVIGAYVCTEDGLGTECGAEPADPPELVESSCADFIDNDCDGFVDSADGDCSGEYADLGVTCSLPYELARPGSDCTGKHTIEFSGGDGVELRADLLALDVDGSLLTIIEDVQMGDSAHLASRLDPEDWHASTKSNVRGTRHTMFYPMPLLRVTGTKGTVEDVAYCSIMPYLDVTDPDGLTISLSEGNTVEVAGYLPLVDVDTLQVMLNGVDLLTEIGIDLSTDLPTETALCTVPGDCVFQMEAGCGDGSLVDVEVQNLVVEGLDTSMAYDAKTGTEYPDQVNTLSFDLVGLPAGGHIVYLAGMPLPLVSPISEACFLDDLADTGTASAFGITVDSPEPLEVVASAPVYVEGTVCGGNEIAEFSINGHDVDVTQPFNQECTTGDGMTSADECVVDFSEPIEQTDLTQAVAGSAPVGTFKRGSNRIIGDALDVKGNRTFNTDTIFGLGEVQTPSTIAAYELADAVRTGVGGAFMEAMSSASTTLDPAFVVGLEESAVQDFFNEKCSDAINQFTSRVEANLSGKTFATLDAEPGCSCDLNNVPIRLENLSFTPWDEAAEGEPTCAVDFTQDQFGVTVHLPDIHIQVGANKTCTTRGLFGECLARTKIKITAVTNVEDLSFEFVITEDNIENKTEPPSDFRVFNFTVVDNGGEQLFNPGTCSGGTQNGEACTIDAQCPGGTCEGESKNASFDPITSNDSGIECWGAAVCSVFQYIGLGLVELFTLGFADGADVVDLIDFDFEFEADFLEELTAAEPDAMEIDEIEIDEEKVNSFGHTEFSPLPIDVEIEDGGLTAEFGGEFSLQSDDPEIEITPPPPATPASVPTVSEIIANGDEVSILIADDVFTQMFWAMKESGALKAFCTNADGLTVDSLLPAPMDGGCDSLGDPTTIAGVSIQGLCHAVRGNDCESLTADTGALEATKQGVCHGASGDDCTTIPVPGPLLGATEKAACNITPEPNIAATDGLMLCARLDNEPDFLFYDASGTNATVSTSLLLNDLTVLLGLDRALDGYTGSLESLPGCFSEDGTAAPDCRLYSACLDLTLNTDMGIDNSTCSVGETGFVFSLNDVIPSGLQPGVICGAPVETDDDTILAESLDSAVVGTVSENAEAFTPPFCAEGLTLGGVLDFTSDGTKLFTVTTDGGTGFADYLGITGSLGPPE